MFTSSYWFDGVFGTALTIRIKVGMLCKNKIAAWMGSVVTADLHTEISKSWHVNFR